MAAVTEVAVKPVKSFVIRPMNDGETSAFVFETVGGHQGFRIAHADIGRMVSLILAEQAKRSSVASAADGPPLPLQGLDVAQGRDETEIVLTADFGGLALPMTIDRDQLARTLTRFLQLVHKDG